jgi:DNA-binding GntR family transcriptional regulator
VASQPSFRAVAHVRRPRLSDTITDQIEDLIATGKLKPGDRIRFAAEMKGGNAIVSRYEMAK